MQILKRTFRNTLLLPIITLTAALMPAKTAVAQQLISNSEDITKSSVYFLPNKNGDFSYRLHSEPWNAHSSQAYKQIATLTNDFAFIGRSSRTDNGITPRDLEGLTIITDTNFAGGVSHCFDDISIQKLKARIQRPDSLLEYKAPIENDKNIYLRPFGYYFANRPNRNKKRPHLGLDIFVSPNSQKPNKPVLIQAPIDGVVISHKRARKKDNVIANCVILLGRDGRKYSFDHLARPEDYQDSIPMPTVGTILKAGDPIGYVGSTGETTLWHLHFTVMTDEQLKKQKEDKYWQKIASQSPYSKLKGQVNPLNPKDAGRIAYLLSKYKGGNLNLIGNFKLEE